MISSDIKLKKKRITILSNTTSFVNCKISIIDSSLRFSILRSSCEESLWPRRHRKDITERRIRAVAISITFIKQNHYRLHLKVRFSQTMIKECKSKITKRNVHDMKTNTTSTNSKSRQHHDVECMMDYRIQSERIGKRRQKLKLRL